MKIGLLLAFSLFSSSAFSAEPVCTDAVYRSNKLGLSKINNTIQGYNVLAASGRMPALCYRLASLGSSLAALLSELNTRLPATSPYFDSKVQFASKVKGFQIRAVTYCGERSALLPDSEVVTLSDINARLLAVANDFKLVDQAICSSKK